MANKRQLLSPSHLTSLYFSSRMNLPFPIKELTMNFHGFWIGTCPFLLHVLVIPPIMKYPSTYTFNHYLGTSWTIKSLSHLTLIETCHISSNTSNHLSSNDLFVWLDMLFVLHLYAIELTNITRSPTCNIGQGAVWG